MHTFILPHDHGEYHNSEEIRRELGKTNNFYAAAELFKQLGDHTRIRIFWLLCHREECVLNLSALLEMSSPAVSHHLRTLRDCGIVVSRREGKEVYYKAADTELSRLLHLMVEQVMEIACPEGKGTSNAEIIRRVHDYLVEHLAERITIADLSRQFLINPTTLKAMFKSEYGNSVAAHIKEHRMEKAAKLLAETQNSVAQIAKEVGFESQSRFSDAFKETYGVLPTEYRKLQEDR